MQKPHQLRCSGLFSLSALPVHSPWALLVLQGSQWAQSLTVPFSLCHSTALPTQASWEAIHLFVPAPSAGNFYQGLISTRGSGYSFSLDIPDSRPAKPPADELILPRQWGDFQRDAPTAITLTALAGLGLAWKQPWATLQSLRKPKVKDSEVLSLQDTEGHMCSGLCQTPLKAPPLGSCSEPAPGGGCFSPAEA